MTAREICDLLERLGVEIYRGPDGTARLRGKIPGNLMSAIRERKDEVVSLWESTADARSDRFGKPPPADLPLRKELCALSGVACERLIRYVSNQPKAVCDWVMLRQSAYWQAGHRDHTRIEHTACFDALKWQRQHRPAAADDPVAWLAGLDSSVGGKLNPITPGRDTAPHVATPASDGVRPGDPQERSAA